MFILRVLPKQGAEGSKDFHGVESNQVLGDQYQYINRETNPEEFRKAFQIVFGKPHVADLDEKSDNYTKNCYGFISTQDGYHRPLYKNQHNWIMTDSGNTFANVTYK